MNSKQIIKLILSLGLLFFTACDKNHGDYRGPGNSLADIHEGEPVEGKVEHPFLKVIDESLSTFSVDVDTAAYTHTRRSILKGRLPLINKIRTEEFTNYFEYPQTEPRNFPNPLAVSFEVGEAPWTPEHRLLKTIVKAKEIPSSDVPPLNLVFLIDVSGSMFGEGRLQLSKFALNFIVDYLRSEDKISIVTYSSAVTTLLEGASGDKR